MTDREIIEMLMKEVKSVGVTCLTMVSYVEGIWAERMQKCSDSCMEALNAAREHVNEEEE